MTVNRGYFSWQTFGKYPKPGYDHSSPNLLLLHDELVRRGMVSMGRGGYNPRPIREGTAPSSHAFGAAIDIRWPDLEVADQVIAWMIEWSLELGVQRIHDYGRGRYWQAGKGWLMRPPGVGDMRSLHIETTPDEWRNTTPIADRGIAGEPPTAPPKYPGKALKLGSTGASVKRVQAVVGVAQDGKYGPITDAAVRRWQTAHDLEVDGIVGPKTWAAMFNR